MALLAAILIVILGALVVPFLQSVMGKPVFGTLHVPQGNNHVDVVACDCGCLMPFKCGQVFDVSVVPTAHSMVNSYTGEELSGQGAIAFRGTPIGFADWSSAYTQVLWKLTSRYTKVIVKAVILGVSAEGHPNVRLNLPNPSWFARAMRNAEENGEDLDKPLAGVE